jgi:hypothetical protein
MKGKRSKKLGKRLGLEQEEQHERKRGEKDNSGISTQRQQKSTHSLFFSDLIK